MDSTPRYTGLTTAERWCDDLNARRVLTMRDRDALLEACGLTLKDILGRYGVGASNPGNGNVWSFLDGTTARRDANGRWEVVTDAG